MNRAINKNFYVDDYLNSFDYLEEAIQMCNVELSAPRQICNTTSNDDNFNGLISTVEYVQLVAKLWLLENEEQVVFSHRAHGPSFVPLYYGIDRRKILALTQPS